MSNELTLKQAIGQMLVAGFDGSQPAAGIRELLSGHHLGGYILFRRNIESLEQVAQLNRELQEYAGDDPVALAYVDQEGGRVRRLREGVTPIPPMAEVGRAGLSAASAVGRVLGVELAALGFHVDLAPVLDISTNPQNSVIGDRAFSSDAEEVARLGWALANGLHEGGVVSCGKHFPGHGDTRLDSHFDLPEIGHSRERLESIEWLPFQRAVAEQMPMLMSAHIRIPTLDSAWPATLSPGILQGVLRDELGFDGLVITDDLDMGAIRDHFDFEIVVRQAIKAGVDLLLICHSTDRQFQTLEIITKLVQDGEIPASRIHASANRLQALRQRFTLRRHRSTDLSRVGCAEHRQQLADVGLG